MKPARTPRPAPTHERLLAAAARTFARDGLAGATTRAIAREAGVNEVTLFRHFRTKERLLAAVIGRNFQTAPAAALPAPSADLRADLRELVQRFDRALTDNVALIRTMIGEVQHHGAAHERQVFKATFQPFREALLARLRAAVADRRLRPGKDPELLTDLLVAMIFTGVLRRTTPNVQVDTPAEAYLDAAIDLFLEGAAP